MKSPIWTMKNWPILCVCEKIIDKKRAYINNERSEVRFVIWPKTRPTIINDHRLLFLGDVVMGANRQIFVVVRIRCMIGLVVAFRILIGFLSFVAKLKNRRPMDLLRAASEMIHWFGPSGQWIIGLRMQSAVGHGWLNNKQTKCWEQSTILHNSARRPPKLSSAKFSLASLSWVGDARKLWI